MTERESGREEGREVDDIKHKAAQDGGREGGNAVYYLVALNNP